MLVDDHELVRQGLRTLVEATVDLIVVGEAGTVEEAVETAERTRPEVVIMDVRLGARSGVEATREIRARHPEIRVLMLTAFEDDEALLASILAGASGYALKQVRGDDLVQAIRTVSNGETLLDPVAAHRIIGRLCQDRTQDWQPNPLSDHEERILQLIAAGGATNQEIAADLGLAEKTVRNYVASILAKLQTTGRMGTNGRE